jgi:4-hydroxy-3-polyprenylbenzoate decarboxylase
MPGPGSTIIIGISGASGALVAQRVIRLATAANVHVHLAVTTFGRRLLHDELGMTRIDADALADGRGHLVTVHGSNDLGASIASGSFRHDGMIIVPASGNTVGALASGQTPQLLHRAALVTLKERRRLIVAHRESPLTTIDLENLRRLAEAGAIVAPLTPGFYFLPRTVDDIVDFMAGRLVDLLGIEHDLQRWDGAVPDGTDAEA